jgi:hypothetical protein
MLTLLKALKASFLDAGLIAPGLGLVPRPSDDGEPGMFALGALPRLGVPGTPGEAAPVHSPDPWAELMPSFQLEPGV